MNDDAVRPIIEDARALARDALPGFFGSGADVTLIAGGGSERRFFRLFSSVGSAVALSESEGSRELDSYVALAEFLGRHGIGVPEIYAVDRERRIILMEDLGDVHLETALASCTPAETEELYARCLELLARLQTEVTESMRREGVLAGKPFDEGTLLGETDYFRREFIEGFCPVPVPGSFDEERRSLARRLAAEPPVFMHRDFQSRNIMVQGGRLRLVDFQTAHRGPGLYDAASLLCDSYHPLPSELRTRLLERYYARLAPHGALGHASFGQLRDTFTLAAIQRTMQALAAFAKLGLRRGKPRFLDSIPSGLDLLEGALEESGRFPGIRKLMQDVRARIEKGR